MTADIDDRFLDVYFPDDPNYVFGDLGVSFCASFPDYEAAEPLLTWEQIDAAIEFLDANPEAGLDHLITWILNQLREGSCVGNATTQGLQTVWNKQLGKEREVRLAAISLYKQIGRSPNSGAMVSDAMDAIREVGILPLDTPENRKRFGNHVMPATGFYTPYPPDWKQTAAKFRGVEFLVIRSLQAMFSALVKGHPVVVGREGHSILYVRPMQGRRVKYANSWGAWGTSGGTLPHGFGIDSANQVQKSASWAFAIRAVSVPEAA